MRSNIISRLAATIPKQSKSAATFMMFLFVEYKKNRGNQYHFPLLLYTATYRYEQILESMLYAFWLTQVLHYCKECVRASRSTHIIDNVYHVCVQITTKYNIAMCYGLTVVMYVCVSAWVCTYACACVCTYVGTYDGWMVVCTCLVWACPVIRRWSHVR